MNRGKYSMGTVEQVIFSRFVEIVKDSIDEMKEDAAISEQSYYNDLKESVSLASDFMEVRDIVTEKFTDDEYLFRDLVDAIENN